MMTMAVAAIGYQTNENLIIAAAVIVFFAGLPWILHICILKELERIQLQTITIRVDERELYRSMSLTDRLAYLERIREMRAEYVDKIFEQREERRKQATKTAAADRPA